MIAPWEATLTAGQYMLIWYALAVAGLALFAGFLRAAFTVRETSPRYRTASLARLGITAVASLSYVLLIVGLLGGYRRTEAGWVPNADAVMAFAPRYAEWSITVPLLAIELLAVCTLLGTTARRARAFAIAGAFLMIFCGYIGAFVIDEGTSTIGLASWGALSCAFWIATTVVLIRAVKSSLPFLTLEAAALLRRAAILLLAGWIVFPVLYVLPFFGMNGTLATVMQVGFTLTDVTIKLGFASLVHRIAKLRTAEDVRAGIEIHSESIWISSVKKSDAGIPPEVYLESGSAVHEARRRPVSSYAVGTPAEPTPDHDLP